MNYIERFVEKFGDISITPTGKNGENPVRESESIAVDLPAKPAERVIAVSAVPSPEKPPDFSPPWPPRPAELARWPIPWRQRWGELSNRLEDEGVRFPESERRAFDQVKAEMEAKAS